MYESIFANTGKDTRAIQIYLELRRLGEQPVSIVARRMGLKRTSMYYVLKRMEEMGIVRARMKRGVRLYAARQLNDVIATIRKQQDALRQSEARFRQCCREMEAYL